MPSPLTNRRGPSYDRTVIDKARERRRYGDSYRVIADELGVPQTTVQYWTRGVATDRSGRWSLADALGDPDPAIVLTELAAVMANSNGRIGAMTRDEARWVTLLGRVRPDILQTGRGSVWQLARMFIEASDDEIETHRLEMIVIDGLR